MKAELIGTPDWLTGLAPQPVPPAPGDKTLADNEPDWPHLLLRTKRGNPTACLQNALLALRCAPEWKGVLQFNESALQVVAKAPPPWDSRDVPFDWRDDDDVRAAAWMQQLGVMISKEVMGQAIQTVAREFPFHPIREYLNGLRWDKIPRIDDWVTLYLGVDPSDYTRAVGAKWLIGAVARVFQPGCKNDTCLVLEGRQGSLKSTTLKILADPWFTDEIADLGTKDAALQVRGVWIIELAELDAMGRPEASRIKAFMSRSVDRYRPPYGRHLIEVPRESVFAGTVNHDTYLKDETGGRRFWPVRCEKISIDELRRDGDQLWAEAVARFRASENWWIDSAPSRSALPPRNPIRSASIAPQLSSSS
jgi:putative DNA primase/helicase